MGALMLVARLVGLLALCIPLHGQAEACAGKGGEALPSSLIVPLALPPVAGEPPQATERRFTAAAHRYWERLGKPVVVGQGLWLVWNVTGIDVGPITRSGSSVSRPARFVVRPVVQFTEPPAMPLPSAPAPRALAGELGESELCVSSVFSLSTAGLALSEHMHNQEFVFSAGYTSHVSEVQLGFEAEKLVVQIELEGAPPEVAGTVTIVGAPKYDPDKEVLYLPAPRVSGPPGVPASIIREFERRITGEPVWKLKTDLEYTSRRLELAIGKTLGSAFRATLDTVRLRDVRVSGPAFIILARAQGRVTLAKPP